MIDFYKSVRSFRFAFQGIWQFFRYENNAKVHLLATALVVAAGVCFQLTKQEWLWIVVAIALVWVTESMNTAIEKLVDIVSPGFDVRAGAVKDLAAGAVLLAALAAVVIGTLIFWPYVVGLLS
ncbi:MAG: diacylglycerol kinase family protein [Bacteroidota bacterium]